MRSPVVSPATPAGRPPTRAEAPPARTEAVLRALVADRRLREPFLGDLAEEFAARCARDGAARARRWYRGQAVRSAPYLVAACWRPAPATRRRRLRAFAAGVAGGYVALQLVHQAAQLLAGWLLAYAGHPTRGPAAGWALASCSLVAGAGCAVLVGHLAGRALPEAPLSAALTLTVTCGTLAVAGMLVNGGISPFWYWGGVQLVVLPAGACVGGLVRALGRHRSQPDECGAGCMDARPLVERTRFFRRSGR